MAPPLLPSTRLTVCPVCAEHVKRADEVCPHCGAALAETRAPAAAAMLMGLALTGCPDKGPDTTTYEPDYGVAATDPMTETTEAATEGTTMVTTGEAETVGASEGMTTTGETGTTGATDPTTSPTGAESDYGVAAL